MKGGVSILFEEFLFGGFFNLFYELTNYYMSTDNKTNYLGYLGAGTISGVLATVLTHPFEISRTKVQSHKVDYTRRVNNSVILSIFVDIYRRYGVKGFAKGLLPRLLKKTLNNAATFYLYEVFRKRKEVSRF